MDEETKKKLEDMEAKVTELTASLAERDKTIAEKDALIAQKNDDIAGQRRKYKKLSEMSEEEKEQLSQKEIELQERAEALEEQQRQFESKQLEVQKKEVSARRDAAIKRLVGDNEEYAEKLRANLDKIKDSDQAFTEDEVSNMVQTAFNMLGDDRPEPVRDAINNSNGMAPGDTMESGFAETSGGKELAGSLGLTTGQPQNPAPAPEPAPFAPQQ